VVAAGTHPRGIDRRTVAPALLVLALAVLMSIVFPLLDSETTYRNEVHEGDVAVVASGITLVPATGWALASGALRGHTRTPVGSTSSTQIVDGSVSFYAQAAPFPGSPDALLTRVNRIDDDLERGHGAAAATTGRYPVTTRQGRVGVAEDFVGPDRQGTIVAFVFGQEPQGQPLREGVEVVVSGPAGPVARLRDDIVAMIRSIRVTS